MKKLLNELIIKGITGKVGIDAIKIRSGRIEEESISDNIDGFTLKRSLENKEECRKIIDTYTGEIICYRSLEWINHGINDLRGLNIISIKPIFGFPQNNFIHATLPTILRGNNLDNINNIDDLEKVIYLLKNMLPNFKMMDQNILNYFIQEVEMNINLKLGPYNEYKQVLDFIFKVVEKNKLKAQKISRINNNYTIENESMKISVYDKKKQVNKIKRLESENIIRIEIKFKNFRRKGLKDIITIKDLFNGGLESLQKEFIRIIYKEFHSNIMDEIRLQKKKKIEQIKYAKITKGLNSILYPLQIGNEFFDMEILLEALKVTSSINNYSAIYKTSIERALETDNPEVLFSNMRKLNEIYDEIGFQKYKPDITKGAEEALLSAEKYLENTINSIGLAKSA